MTPNKPDPTNGEEKMRELRFDYKRWASYHDLDVEQDDEIADWWLAQLKQSHLALLEQIVGENEKKKRVRCACHPNNCKPYVCCNECKDSLWCGYNHALDLINTSLRARIDQFKKI